jgi:outer membrane lipoprotein-sorting protein
MTRGNLILLVVAILGCQVLHAQSAEALMQSVRDKLERVNSYEASGKMKMNVVFIKAPIANVRIFYKKPDKLKINNESGISLIPKGAININMGNIVANAASCDIIDAGKEDKTGLRIIKLLPRDEVADVVLSTLYIDEANAVVRKAKTTTRENGTYELEMSYGKYLAYGLADKVVFTFVTFDYDDGTSNEEAEAKMKNKKGRVEITYSSYTINKSIPDTIFK